MIYGTSAAREVKKLIPEVESIQRAFDERQKQKKIDSLTALKGKASSYQKRKLEQLEACKEHDGPFSKPDDVTKFLARCEVEKRSAMYVKRALKSEVIYARETYTKRPKTDDAFRIRDRTTNKDLSSDQYALNLTTLFSNILAVAEVPSNIVKGAIHKAVAAAGIEFLGTECPHSVSSPTEADLAQPSVDALAAQPPVAGSVVQPAVASPSRITCSIDSPVPISNPDHTFFIHDYVAIATVDDRGSKSWKLGTIDSVDDTAKVSIYIPVPGRMGENRVDIPTNSFLPISPNVCQSKLNSEDVYIVSNHEELDEVLTRTA